MNVVSKRGLLNLTARRGDAEAEALDWYRAASAAEWSCFADVYRAFADADMVGEVIVFNLCHNRYRLAFRQSQQGQRQRALRSRSRNAAHRPPCARKSEP